jgi:hypothetical protein
LCGLDLPGELTPFSPLHFPRELATLCALNLPGTLPPFGALRLTRNLTTAGFPGKIRKAFVAGCTSSRFISLGD